MISPLETYMPDRMVRDASLSPGKYRNPKRFKKPTASKQKAKRIMAIQKKSRRRNRK